MMGIPIPFNSMKQMLEFTKFAMERGEIAMHH